MYLLQLPLAAYNVPGKRKKKSECLRSCWKQGPLRGSSELCNNWVKLFLTGVEEATMESAKMRERMLLIFTLLFIPFLSDCQVWLCTSFSLYILVCDGGHMWWIFFIFLRSVGFYFVVMCFWPAISLMHQLVKAKCGLACQQSLCISVNFCLLKTLLSAAASNSENRSQESVIRSFFPNCIMLHS